MLHTIIRQVQEDLKVELLDDYQLTEDQISKAFDSCERVIKEGIKKEAGGSNLDGLMDLFTSGECTEEGARIYNAICADLEMTLIDQAGVKQGESAIVSKKMLDEVIKEIKTKLGETFGASELLEMFVGDGDDFFAKISKIFKTESHRKKD